VGLEMVDVVGQEVGVEQGAKHLHVQVQRQRDWLLWKLTPQSLCHLGPPACMHAARQAFHTGGVMSSLSYFAL
jgi:hypothetical protein